MADAKLILSGLDRMDLVLRINEGLSEIEGIAFALAEAGDSVMSTHHRCLALFGIARAARELGPYVEEAELRMQAAPRVADVDEVRHA
jgi:hypothetical protein